MSIEKLLSDKKLKITRHRLDVLNVINSLDVEATNKKILEDVDIDKSTFYRTIQTFLDNDIIETSINHRNELYYMLRQEHRHYIKCIKCHKKEEINICPVDDLEKKGFHVIKHKIEIDGICGECSRND